MCYVHKPFFGCRGGQELDVIPLVSRDAARQEDGISLSVVVEEADDVVDLHISQSIVRYAFSLLVNPNGETRSQKTSLTCHKAILS